MPTAYGWSFVHYDREAIYRIDNVVTRTAYRPLLWLDQKVRPQYWSWSENERDTLRNRQPPPPP